MVFKYIPTSVKELQVCTKWFKYDLDVLCVNLATSVPVIFEPPCISHVTDIAVGAPYDGPEHRGAVYIFHGSKKGIMEKPSQVIQAGDIFSTISTFGFSLAGGVDLDENEYPDLVVGAYEADTAVYLRYK